MIYIILQRDNCAPAGSVVLFASTSQSDVEARYKELLQQRFEEIYIDDYEQSA